MMNAINIAVVVVLGLFVLVAICDAIAKRLNDRDERNGNQSHLIAKSQMDLSYIEY
jgi:hypothetical protein